MLKNITKNTIISKEIKYASGFADKTSGMLLKRNSGGLILKTRFGIHTFFMKVPIDVMILNGKNEVVKIKTNLKPNRVFVWNLKFYKVIELPAGSIKKSRSEIKDLIDLP